MTNAWSLLDDLADAITKVKVVGQTETEALDETTAEDRNLRANRRTPCKSGLAVERD
jgi:hypothetical protein